MDGFRFRRLAAVGVGLLLPLAGCAGPATTKPGKEGKGNGNITSVLPAASGVRSPMDAMPSPDGKVIYFTALGEAASSLWSVSFTGGEPKELATGFVAPIGLVVSTDGDTVFVADAAAEEPDTDLLGQIVAVPADGGDATVVDGTQGFAPKGLEVRGETLFFTGTDPADGAHGVFSVASGAITTVASGAPFTDPSGIAADDDVLYVTDASASFDESGAVIRIVDGQAEVIVPGLHVGSPAGIVLVEDSSALLVSGLDVLGTGGAQVYRIELDGLEVLTANAGIADNDEAGGLHRAHGKDAYAWAGTTTVFALK